MVVQKNNFVLIPEISKMLNLNVLLAVSNLPSMYIVLGFISNLEIMILSIQENVYKSYTNTTSFV